VTSSRPASPRKMGISALRERHYILRCSIVINVGVLEFASLKMFARKPSWRVRKGSRPPVAEALDPELRLYHP
jgi:hypothetical protein